MEDSKGNTIPHKWTQKDSDNLRGKKSKSSEIRGMLARKLKHGLKNLENARPKGSKTIDILHRHNEKE